MGGGGGGVGGGSNKKGGRGSPTKNLKINKRGEGGGLLFGTGEYRENKHNFASVGLVSFKIKQKDLIV